MFRKRWLCLVLACLPVWGNAQEDIPAKALDNGKSELQGNEQFNRARPSTGRPAPEQMLQRMDANGDGVLQRNEIPQRMWRRLVQLDKNGDGKLDKEELRQEPRGQGASAQGAAGGAAPPADGLFRLLDRDGNGKLSREELEKAPALLEKLDRNQDGTLDREETVASSGRGGRPGEVITPAARGERFQDKLQVGDEAPDFKLPTSDGKAEIQLSSFRGKLPVVLVFASYT